MSRTYHARPSRNADTDGAPRRIRSASMARRARRTATRQAWIAAHSAGRI